MFSSGVLREFRVLDATDMRRHGLWGKEKFVQKFRISMGVLIVLWAIGCAGQGKDGFAQVEARLPELTAGSGRIYIYTPIRSFFLDFVPKVLVNGKPVGHSLSGTFLVVDEPAGDYTVDVADEKIFSDSGGQLKSESATVKLKAGETAYIRLHAMDSTYFIQMKSIPEDEKNGQRDLKILSFNGGNVLPLDPSK